MPSPQPVRISIEEIDTIAVLRQAIVRHDAMKRTGTAYKGTTLRMQDVGLLGEHAVDHWLRQNHPNVVTIADTPEAQRTGAGDLAVIRQVGQASAAPRSSVAVTFEVKTSRYTSWRRYGRTLDAAQLARSTAHAYIWCVVSNDWPTESVLLMGWLPTTAIRTPAGGMAIREHDRPHWRVTASMRPMRDLPDWWSSLPIAPL